MITLLLFRMNAKCLLALAIVAALVVLVTPYYAEEDNEEMEKRGAEDDFDMDDFENLLQKRGRGRQYIRCIDQSTGERCACDRVRGRMVNRCKK